jgi:hypothetical protein
VDDVAVRDGVWVGCAALERCSSFSGLMCRRGGAWVSAGADADIEIDTGVAGVNGVGKGAAGNCIDGCSRAGIGACSERDGTPAETAILWWCWSTSLSELSTGGFPREDGCATSCARSLAPFPCPSSSLAVTL